MLGLALPPLAAFALVSYGVAPAHLGGLLLTGAWHEPAVWAFGAAAAFLYLDFWLLQDQTCRVCFYGYLQSVASYGRAPGVRRNPERVSACHGCTGCRDACFVGVDPRRRFWEWNDRGTDLAFDGCITCGECVVACDDLTSRRGRPLIMELPPNIVWPAEKGGT
jgi:polyferredoxin